MHNANSKVIGALHRHFISSGQPEVANDARSATTMMAGEVTLLSSIPTVRRQHPPQTPILTCNPVLPVGRPFRSTGMLSMKQDGKKCNFHKVIAQVFESPHGPKNLSLPELCIVNGEKRDLGWLHVHRGQRDGASTARPTKVLTHDVFSSHGSLSETRILYGEQITP